MSAESKKIIYTKKEAAAQLGISLTTLNNLICARKIGYIKTGVAKSNRVLFREDHLTQYVNSMPERPAI